MTVVHLPLLLGGFAFLAVPLLILLLHRRRLVLRWAAYYWMEKALRQKKKRIQLTEILKLLSKLLLVALLALFLARPRLASTQAGNVVLILDTSLSMGTRLGAQTRLDRAKGLASLVLDSADAAIALCTFDGRLHVVSQFQRDRASLRRLLAEVTLSAQAAGVDDLVRALTDSGEIGVADQVLLFSDFQQSWYGDGAALGALGRRLGRGRPLVLVPVETRARVPNLALTEHRLPAEGIYPGRQNEILARVENHSDSTLSDVPVTLSLGGVSQDRALVSLGPGQACWVTLSFALAAGGEQELVLSLPPDDFPVDDRLFVQVHPRDQLNLLAVVPERPADCEFELDLFLENALKAVGRETAWQYHRVLPQQVLQETLSNYDSVLVLAVPLRRGDLLVPILTEYLRSGGGVISFADASATDVWSGFGVKALAAGSDEVTPDPDRLQGTYLGFLAEPGLDPTRVRFSRYLPIAVETPAARLLAGGLAEPLMARCQIGRGVLILAGFLPYPGYTDLQYNPNFVQFCARVVWDGLNQQPTAGLLGREIESLCLPGLDTGNRYALTGPDGVPVPVPVQVTATGPAVHGPPAATGGFWVLFENDTPRYRFGYNPTRADSAVQPAAGLLEAPAATAAADGLLVVREPELASLSASRELALAAALFLILALILENYAHLVRRN